MSSASEPALLREPAPRQWPVWAALCALVAVGAFLRFWRLGELGLIVDEGYQAVAVSGALRDGVPRLGTGYVYTRALPFIYLQAAMVWLCGFTEWAMRAPAALFGVLLIPVSFWFGRALFGTRAGLVTALLMALSAWEIEYARYARFYTLFQCMYLISLVAFYRGFLAEPVDAAAPDRRGRWRVAFAVLFVATVFIHSLGLMLIMGFACLLPLRGYSVRRRLTYAAMLVIGGGVWAGHIKADKYLSQSLSTSPPQARVAGGLVEAGPKVTEGFAGLMQRIADVLPSTKLPDPRFFYVAWEHHRGAMIAVVVLASLVSLGVIWLGCRGRGASESVEAPVLPRRGGAWNLLRVALLLVILWSAVIHLASLALVAGAAYAACFVRRWRGWRDSAVLLTAGAAMLGFAAWVVWFRQSPRASLTEGLEELLSFPDLNRYFFKWMIYGWPAMLLLLVPATLYLARRAVTDDPETPRRDGKTDGWANDRVTPAWFVLASFALPAVVTSQLAWRFSESRYFLHLYPLMLLALAVTAVALADTVGRLAMRLPRGTTPPRAVAIVLTSLVAAVLVFAAGDTDPRKAWDVSSRTHASYRDPIRAVLNFRWHADFHHDQKSVAEATRPLIGPDDVIITVGPPHQTTVWEHYLGRVDYVATSPAPYDALSDMPDGRQMDLKSGARLVTTAADLASIRAAAQGRDVWFFSDWPLVADDCWYLSDAEPELKELVKAWMSNPDWVGKDGKTTANRLAGGPYDRDAHTPSPPPSHGETPG